MGQKEGAKMEREIYQTLAASLPASFGWLTPATTWIEQAVEGSWTAFAFFPDGNSRKARAFKTARAARDWALSQKMYRPTVAEVTHNGRFGCD